MVQESLNTKHVVSLDYALQRISAQLTKRLDSLEHTVAHRTVTRSWDVCDRQIFFSPKKWQFPLVRSIGSRDVFVLLGLSWFMRASTVARKSQPILTLAYFCFVILKEDECGDKASVEV